VGRLEDGAGHGVVDAAAPAGDLRTGRVHDLFLSVVHEGGAFADPLGHHGPGRQGAIGVEHFDPVVVDDPGLAGVDFRNPHHWAAAIERQHQQIV